MFAGEISIFATFFLQFPPFLLFDPTNPNHARPVGFSGCPIRSTGLTSEWKNLVFLSGNGSFLKWGTPIVGWFMMENSIFYNMICGYPKCGKFPNESQPMFFMKETIVFFWSKPQREWEKTS
jgi:hypothetical protein